MTLKTNSLEGGTDGTTIDTSNSGGASGDAFDTVTIGSGCTLTYATAAALHGSLGAQFYSSYSSGQNYLVWNISAPSAAARVYFKFPGSLPSGNAAIIRFYSGGGSYPGMTLYTVTRHIRVYDGVNSWVGTVFNGSLAADTLYRVEMAVAKGTGSGDGILRVAIYAGEDTTPLDSYDHTNVNTGTTDFTSVRFSLNWAPTNIYTTYADDFAVQTNTTTFIGPVSAGPSSAIKTVNGLAKASIKTVNGLAIASVKTVVGLA